MTCGIKGHVRGGGWPHARVTHVQFQILNFVAISLVPYWNLTHSFFNPRLSSLVLLKECKKHCFRLQNTRDLFLLEKKAPGRAAPHRIQSGNAQSHFKFISKSFQNAPYPCMGPFSENHPKIWWRDPWPGTSSENHTHARVRGSKGAMRTCLSFVIKIEQALIGRSHINLNEM